MEARNKKTAEDRSNGKIQNFENRFVDKDKGPIKIRVRERAKGNFVLFLDYYVGDGKHKYDYSMNLFLVPENGRNDTINKSRNTKTWEQAKAIKAQKIIDLQNENLDLSQTKERKNANVIPYIARLIESAKKEGDTSTTDGFAQLSNHLQTFEGSEKIIFAEISRDYILNFLHYLKTAKTLKNPKEGKQRRRISNGTACLIQSYFSKLMTQAAKDKIIDVNPFLLLSRDEKLKWSPSKIEFLTKEEVQRLIDTECTNPVLKKCFLFCCSAGLRFSDATALTWGDIYKDDFYGVAMKLVVKKSGRQEIFPLPEPALQCLPSERGAADEKIFPLVYDHRVSDYLKKWTEAAGIYKTIKFHSSRHTAATLNLSLGADIATVSKLLGHSSIKTTQIYAEVVNESKKKAVALQSGVFKF